MPYQFSQEAERILADVRGFMDEYVYPNEDEYEASSKRPATAIRRCSTS